MTYEVLVSESGPTAGEWLSHPQCRSLRSFRNHITDFELLEYLLEPVAFGARWYRVEADADILGPMMDHPLILAVVTNPEWEVS